MGGCGGAGIAPPPWGRRTRLRLRMAAPIVAPFMQGDHVATVDEASVSNSASVRVGCGPFPA